MCDLLFAYIDPKPLKLKDSQLLLDLFLLDAIVFNTDEFNTIFDLFMSPPEQKKSTVNFKRGVGLARQIISWGKKNDPAQESNPTKKPITAKNF